MTHTEGEPPGNDKREQHLRSADFFDTEGHPQVQFVSNAIMTVDQRELGMTWSPFGITRSPATLTVHAQLASAVTVARADRPGR